MPPALPRQSVLERLFQKWDAEEEAADAAEEHRVFRKEEERRGKEEQKKEEAGGRVKDERGRMEEEV